MNQTETYTMKGVPADQVDQFITVAKNDKRYVSHQIETEPNGTKTITITIKVNADEGDSVPASE